MTTTALIPSVSIEALVQRRNAMVERVTEAHRLLTEADRLGSERFGESKHRWWGGHTLALQFAAGPHSSRYFTEKDGLERAIKQIDTSAWSYLMSESGLESFLDAAARKKWRESLDKEDVPELTVKNIEATFSMLFSARGEMFERGVVEMFRKLSWDYKTNTPVMFGKRLVLHRAVDTWGGRQRFEWCRLGYRTGDELDDLMRVMSILDGKPEPDHRTGAAAQLRAANWPGECQVMEVGGYFSIKGFKNGNAHLTFLREDLVETMNKILAKHHPNALPPTREAA